MRTLFALLSCVCFLNPALADDDDIPPQKPAAKTAPSPANSENTIEQLAGIKTQTLTASTESAEFISYGKVLNLDALLQLRQQYLAAITQQSSAKARHNEAHLNLARTENLHQQSIVSNRRLQEQQALAQADKALLDASTYQQQTLLNNCRLDWGETLSAWFCSTNHPETAAFLNHQAQLVQITLPANHQLPSQVKQIWIDAHGQRQTAIVASLISASPQIDTVSQGQNYFFKIQNRRIPYGSHLTAWIPTGDHPTTTAVEIPASAIVRHLGQNQVFIKDKNGHFQRISLNQLSKTATGYLTTDGVQAGDQIVVTGAQTLLSQELKAQIPDEDDD